MTPFWSQNEQDELLKLLREGKNLEEMAEHFHRSPEATRHKVHRLVSDEQWNRLKKSQLSQRKTAPLPEIKPAEELLTEQEVRMRLLGALKQLQQPGISPAEIRRCRAVVFGVRTYLTILKQLGR